MAIQFPSRARKSGFTLVELLVVIAILSTLAAIALPAYNNYTLKSKFTEVVQAAAPTQTAISTCAVSGDCLSGNAISLAQSGGGSGPSTVTLSSTVAMTRAQTYAAVEATYISFGSTTATAQTNATNFVANGNAYYLIPATSLGQPSNICISNVQGSSSCTFVATTLALANSFMTAANPYYSASASGTQSLPCVGASVTGCSPSTKYVASVSYDASGVITSIAQTTSGLNSETFVLVPSYSGGRVDWMASGSCKTRAGGALC